jgi:hypothetical protein
MMDEQGRWLREGGSTMKPEIIAYLMQDNERVSEMPTDEILIALDQLLQASSTREQSMSCDNAACYEFLQAVKLTMQAVKEGEKP